jgi:protein TonB
MKEKKNPRYNLENYKLIFFLFGLVLSLSLVIWLFNIKFYNKPVEFTQETDRVYTEEDVIPITKQKLPEAPPPPVPEIIEVVSDEVELEVELDIATTETDQSEAVEWEAPVAIEDEEEVPEEVLNFAVVERVPVFPGCEGAKTNDERKACFQQKLLEYVVKNFSYPPKARELNIQGRVYVKFVIEKDGTVSNIEVLRGVDPLLDDAAVACIRSLPRISPAEQRGKPVRMSFVLPIYAKME